MVVVIILSPLKHPFGKPSHIPPYRTSASSSHSANTHTSLTAVTLELTQRPGQNQQCEPQEQQCHSLGEGFPLGHGSYGTAWKLLHPTLCSS